MILALMALPAMHVFIVISIGAVVYTSAIVALGGVKISTLRELFS